MKILRNKFFAVSELPNSAQQMPPSPTSKDMAMEQMKLQRQILQTQRMREQIQAQESRDRMKNLQTAQRIEQQKDEQLSKNRIKVAKLDKDKGAENVSLYKSRSKITEPVPMK